MRFDRYKDIKINKDLKVSKEMIIAGVAIATVSTIAVMSTKIAKKKKETAIKLQKETELANLIEELEDVSTKIVELSKTQEDLNILIQQKEMLKNNFTLKPY